MRSTSMAKYIVRQICFFIAAGIILSASYSCKNPMGITIRQTVEDYSKPTYTVSPGDEDGISLTTSIKIGFSESMDVNSLKISGIMAAEGCDGIWSANNASNDTLTISPESRWPVGSNKTLVINCKDLDGYDIQPISLTYGIIDGIVYVHDEKGDDSFPGTPDKPKKTIQAAVDLAERYYDEAEVHVAEGVYEYSKSITIKAGISLLGGFSKTDWSEREINPNWAVSENFKSKYTTSIIVINGTALAYLDIYKTIIIEGFNINADDKESYGIYCNNINSIIRCNYIQGGTGGISLCNCKSLVELNTIIGGLNESQEYAWGISTSDGTDIIQNNIIKGNLASLNQFSAGIFSDSNVIVRGNEIYGGVSNYVTYGIMNGFNSTPLIYNNIIHSGKATEGKDGWGTIGIYIDNADSIIQNNYIIGEEILWDTGVCREIGIFINNSYNTIIENNIILTKASVTEAKRIGISSTTNIASLCLKNNNIIDCPTALYEFLNDSPITDITKLNECTFASGNISLDPIFADKERGNYHLTASSPVEVRQGGLDLSAQFADDKDGNTRTTMVTGSPTNEGAAGWSMGAYECDEN